MSINRQMPIEKEYNTEMEYLQQQIIFLNDMHNYYLEEKRKIDDIIESLKIDLNKIQTPELKQIINNMMIKQDGIRKQALDIIKRSLKDLGFVKSIYKQVKENYD